MFFSFFSVSDHDGSGPPPHKKKHKSADRSPPLSSPSSSTDTAMGLLQAITSPLATGSDPNPHLHKKPSYPSFSSHSSKDRKRESSSTGGSKGSHSLSHSRPPSSSSSSSKKHSSSSSKSLLFHGGAPKEEPLTLREADGLKMKLIMSPEKEEGESFPFAPHSSKGGVKKERDRDRTQLTKSPKKKQLQQQQSRDPLPVVGKEVEVEGKIFLNDAPALSVPHPRLVGCIQIWDTGILFVLIIWLMFSSNVSSTNTLIPPYNNVLLTSYLTIKFKGFQVQC